MELFNRINTWTEKVCGSDVCDETDELLPELECIRGELLELADTALPTREFTLNIALNLRHCLLLMRDGRHTHSDMAVLRALAHVFKKKSEYDLTVYPHPKLVKARNDRQLGICRELALQKKQPLEEQADKEFDITIVMVTYNQLQLTKDCLDSIFEYTGDVSYEVILIDNGSTDGSFEYFQNDSRIRLIKLPHNIGCLLAMEVFYHSGLDRGRFWMYMNNDVIVTPRWASNMLTCIKSDPAIGSVMPITNRSAKFLMYRNIPFELFDIKQAKEFGERHNQSNPMLWEDKTIIYPFVGLNRPSARKALGYYEDAYYYPFYYADGDISHSLKLAGYRLIFQKDTYVHHFDGGSSVWKNRRMMLDRGENDFFNKFGYFPTDITHHLPAAILGEWSSPKKVLFLGFARGNPADEMAHTHRIWGNNRSEYYAADTFEKFKMEHLNPSVQFARLESWYELDSVFQDEVFDLIVLDDPILTVRDTARLLKTVKNKLANNGQFVCLWENPVDIQNLRYFYITGRHCLRDACRLVKKSYAPLETLVQAAVEAGLYTEMVHTLYFKEDFYIYGIDMNEVSKMCGVSEDDINSFIDRLRADESYISMRKWIPLDEDSQKRKEKTK